MAKQYRTKERIYTTRDGEVVTAGHPAAFRLLYPAGKLIPMGKAEELGLVSSITFPTHVGGGWWELSDGSRVKGRPEAEAAQVMLEGSED